MAVRLDAAADRLSYSAAAPPATITITAWVYLAVDRNDYSAIARLWTGAFGTVGSWETDSDGTSGPWYFTGGGSIGNSTGFVVGEWRRVALTRTGSTGQLLVATSTGATEVDSGTVGTAIPAGITLGGRDTSDNTEWFNGRLAYVRVWSSVLTQAEIEAEWASVTPVKTSELWANWPLSDASDLTDTVAARTLAVASGGSLTTEAGPDLGGGGGDTTGAVAGSLPGPGGSLHEVAEFLTGKLVGGRNLRPSGLITDSGGTYRLKQTARIPVSAMQVTFPGWYTGPAGTGDSACPNAYTIHACYLEHAGTLTPVTFDGSPSVTVPAGGDVHGTVTRTIAAGDDYWIRTYLTPASGGSYPRLYAVVQYPDELCAKGADHANELGSDNLSDYGDVCGPVAITGTPTGGPRYAVAIVGDSIVNGSNDSFADYNRVGYLYRALNGQRPFLLLAVSGEQAAQYLTQGSMRARYVGVGAHYAICTYGVNDLQGGRTLAQTQASLLGIWTSAVAANPTVRVLQTTITPKSSSTDGWATVGSQTADGTVSPNRPALNAWIRAGAPTVAGVAVAPGTSGAVVAGQAGHPLWSYLEVSDVVESARDTGLWKAGYTDDGVHPTETGHIAMAAALNLAQLPDLGSGELGGALPSPAGALSGVMPTAGGVTGQLPAPAGALSGTVVASGVVAGQAPSVAGALVAVVATAGQVGGSTPGPGGPLSSTAVTAGAVGAATPAPVGALVAVAATAGQVIGLLASPTGTLGASGTALAVVAGQIPTPGGGLTGGTVSSGALGGETPGAAGRLTVGAPPVVGPYRAGPPRLLGTALVD